LKTAVEAELANDIGNAKCSVITAHATCESSLDTQHLTYTSAGHSLWKEIAAFSAPFLFFWKISPIMKKQQFWKWSFFFF